MPMPEADDPRRCHATAQGSGKQCVNWSMIGQKVCAHHGGKAPQALESARKRLMFGADSAAAALYELSQKNIEGKQCPMCKQGMPRDENIRAKASTALLDRAGIGPQSKVEVEQVGEARQLVELLTDEQFVQVCQWLDEAKARLEGVVEEGQVATH